MHCLFITTYFPNNYVLFDILEIPHILYTRLYYFVPLTADKGVLLRSVSHYTAQSQELYYPFVFR